MISGKAVCSGYATILTQLCPLIGIECKTIIGAKKNKNGHAWNQVKIGDNWFNVDLTWARDMIAMEGYADPGILKTDDKFKDHSEKKYPRDIQVFEEKCLRKISPSVTHKIYEDLKVLNRKREVCRVIRRMRVAFYEVDEKKDEIMAKLKEKIESKKKDRRIDTEREEDSSKTFD